MTFFRVPNIIWTLWHNGFENAPSLQQECLKSWRLSNPNYTINALTLAKAEGLISRRELIRDDAWNSMTIQTRSDVIRVLLLARQYKHTRLSSYSDVQLALNLILTIHLRNMYLLGLYMKVKLDPF